MDNNKGQTIFLSVIGIATLLVAIIGATFAWFSVTVTGNSSASSIIVTTAVLGSITFEDGSLINLSNVRPQDAPEAEKTFTITNPTSNLSSVITYAIYMNVTENTLSGAANDATGNWFVHQVEVDATGVHDPATSDTFASSGGFDPVPGISEKVLISDASNGTIHDAAVHKYKYTIKYMDNNSNQNAAQGKAFSGRLIVDVVGETPAP